MLLRETGSDVVEEGYNYAIMSIRTKSPIAHGEQILEKKREIERLYRDKARRASRTDSEQVEDEAFELLPFVLRRKSSVIIPVPHETALNLFADSVREVLIGEFSVPSWS